MSYCSECNSRKVIRVKLFQNEYLCLSCGANLKLLRLGLQFGVLEYLPAAILLGVIILTFVTGKNSAALIAIISTVPVIAIYLLLGRKFIYKLM